MKQASVVKLDNGVKISLQKIEGMEVTGVDGNIELSIKGDLDIKEIEEAVSKSPLIK